MKLTGPENPGQSAHVEHKPGLRSRLPLRGVPRCPGRKTPQRVLVECFFGHLARSAPKIAPMCAFGPSGGPKSQKRSSEHSSGHSEAGAQKHSKSTLCGGFWPGPLGTPVNNSRDRKPGGLSLKVRACDHFSESSRRLWLSEIPCWKSFRANFDTAGKFLADFPAARNAIPAKVWALSGKENGCWKIGRTFGNAAGFSPPRPPQPS